MQHKDWAERAATYIVADVTWKQYGPWVGELTELLAETMREASLATSPSRRAWRDRHARMMIENVRPYLDDRMVYEVLAMLSAGLAVAAAQQPRQGDDDAE